MKKIISTEKVSEVVGPYSQAVEAGGFVFLSGQIPLKVDGTIIDGDIKDQTKQVLDNIGEILNASGLNYENVAKVTVYLSDMSDFREMNEVYIKYFKKDFPARSTIQVSELPKEVGIEMDVIAAKE
ncbi:MAG: Rid family detoxifying hydrolase [Candidatus Pacebacteria bacterium]|nr:Rid family detoxifying hydrolase [Candidatus Paceibacterota bacterium]